MNKNQACLKHVSSTLINRTNSENKIVFDIVIPVMNKTTITTNYLKNIYILLVCLNLSFSFSEINAQKDLEKCEWTEYFFSNGNLSSEGCFVDGIPEGIWKSYFKSGTVKSLGLTTIITFQKYSNTFHQGPPYRQSLSIFHPQVHQL